MIILSTSPCSRRGGSDRRRDGTLDHCHHKQPVHEAEVDKIRGVERSRGQQTGGYNLVQELGRLRRAGRPIVFGDRKNSHGTSASIPRDNLPRDRSGQDGGLPLQVEGNADQAGCPDPAGEKEGDTDMPAVRTTGSRRESMNSFQKFERSFEKTKNCI